MGKLRHHIFSAVLIESFSYLQVMRTCIKAWMSLNLGQIPLLTMELAALERLKNRCHHVISVDIDPIFFKLAGNKGMHNITNEFEFRPDRTTDYGVRCPWVSKKYPHRLIIGKMVFPLFLWSKTAEKTWWLRFSHYKSMGISDLSGRNSNSSKILCMSSLPVSLKRIGSIAMEKKWWRRFFRRSRAANSIVSSGIWPKFKLCSTPPQ